jgi:UDP-glucose 4-epimerase
MEKQQVLVSGGLGYIGSHTVVELIEAGYSPIIIDDLSNSNKHILTQIQYITNVKPPCHVIDVCDEKALNSVLALYPNVQDIIHFAASKAVGESVSMPLKYYYNNLLPVLNLLRYYSGKPLRFVFSSSCTVYGEPAQLPVTEETPVQGATSPYGNTKQVAEEILRDAAEADQLLKVVALRYFNPVGAHPSALIGELPLGIPQNLVPFITQTAIGKREMLTVYGDDYDTPDGSCIRDYIHVVDLAKAHIRALKFLYGEALVKNYDVFNIGTGKGLSVLEVIKAFEAISAIKLNYSVGARRLGDAEKIWGDITKAARMLNWQATLGVEEMMKTAWEWEKYINKTILEDIS